MSISGAGRLAPLPAAVDVAKAGPRPHAIDITNDKTDSKDHKCVSGSNQLQRHPTQQLVPASSQPWPPAFAPNPVPTCPNLSQRGPNHHGHRRFLAVAYGKSTLDGPGRFVAKMPGRQPKSSGAPGRIRTCDARFRKPTLYPLSYGSEVARLVGGREETL